MSETPVALPLRLTAPEPGWTVEADVVVIGSGIAGLSCALGYLRRVPEGRVVLVTKDLLSAGSTRWAQGGIAAAIDPGDTPVAHMVDTIGAGAGLCDPLAVNVLANAGPGALRRLIGVGAVFDADDSGEIALTREGGHRTNRVAHAGGDATGAEIQRALSAAVRAEPRIEVIEHALALDTLHARAGAGGGGSPVCGVSLHVMGAGERDGVGAVLAEAVVLATGGMGQVFAATTNPEVSTGDGLALAARAGARLQDLEFVQFHPTVLWLGPEARGQQPLVSEALRGEGAFLVDAAGRRIMEGVHELADLAPRDIVARSIAATMAAEGADHVFLDARHFGAAKWEHRFPTILASCRGHGIDPVTEPIPVAPAAHYASGGVAVDTDGRSSVPGLFAVGEVARSGVHGANRLASNSLLEGLVFAERIAAVLAESPPGRLPPDPRGRWRQPSGLVSPSVVAEVRAAMARSAGVVRSPEGLHTLVERIDGLLGSGEGEPAAVESWEATNLVTVARLVAAAALFRDESRGAHQRSDVPRELPRYRGRPVTLRLEGRGLVSELEPRRNTLPAGLGRELDAIRAPVDTEAGPEGRPESAPAPHEAHVDTVVRALAEDLAGGVDTTTVATIPEHQVRTADVVARADGVVAGLPPAELVFWLVSEGAVEVRRHVADGDRVRDGDTLMAVTARTRDLLTAERTSLNLLTHLSGIATATRGWVDAVSGTDARIRDSRKTHAGLRTLEKYAVRCGGGVNHRYGLSDAALVKDNHVLAAGGVAEAVRAVRDAFPGLPLEVEVDRVDQIEPALKAGAEEILLDNFSIAELHEAVSLVAGRARLESSGGLELRDASRVAATGVDYLAVGALTHSSPALDIGLDLRDTH